MTANDRILASSSLWHTRRKKLGWFWKIMIKPSTTLRMDQLPLEDKDGRWRGMVRDL